MASRALFGFCLLLLCPFKVAAVPVDGLGVDISQNLERQFFPRDIAIDLDCNCCRPASTIVITSTKLSITKSTATIWTTKTTTKTTKETKTSTITPVITTYKAVTVATTKVAPGPGETGNCVPSNSNFLPGGSFDTQQDFDKWQQDSEVGASAVWRTLNQGKGGSFGYSGISCQGRDRPKYSGCSSYLYQDVTLCPTRAYTLSAYHWFRTGDGDGKCRLSVYFNEGRLISVYPTEDTNVPFLPQDPNYQPPWTEISVSFFPPGDGTGRFYFKLECDGDRELKTEEVMLDSVSLVQARANANVENITWITYSVPRTTETVTEWAAATPVVSFQWLGSPAPDRLIKRATTIEGCSCTNVECLTAVATTTKSTLVYTSTVSVSKAVETGVTIQHTTTTWKTVSAKTTITKTITNTATQTFSMDSPGIPNFQTANVISTFTSGYGSEPTTITQTQSPPAQTLTATYTYGAFYPSATYLVRGRPVQYNLDPPVSGFPKSEKTYHQVEEYVGSFCWQNPFCTAFALSYNATEDIYHFGWFSAQFDGFNQGTLPPGDTDFIRGDFPSILDTTVWFKV